MALLVTVGLAVLAYPLAYLRRVRQLVVGPRTRDTRNWLTQPLQALFHATLLRSPVPRAVFHFISQTVLRVQRYRVYLVLYGGVGLSVVVATVLRLTVVHDQVRMEISADGIRAATAIIVFWMIAGLRVTFVSPGNRQGSWVFRIIHGRPAPLDIAMQLLLAAELWVFLWSAFVTLGAFFALRAVAPPELRTGPATASQILIAFGMCLLLTDILFLNVKTVTFTGEPTREQSNLAVTILQYFAFVPAVAVFPLVSEPWIELETFHFVLAATGFAAAHLALRSVHREIILAHCNRRELEDGEEEFPLKLGLRH